MTLKKSDVYHHHRHKNTKRCCNQNRDRRSPKNPDFHKLRSRPKCLRVSELVYKFLENFASVNDERRQRNNARTNFQRTHVRKYSRQNRRPDGPRRSNDQILLQSEYQIPNESFIEIDSRYLPSEEQEQILEECYAVGPLETKSSSQFIEEYVNAVNESKIRPQRYVCEALSFGVDAGFLVPAKNSDTLVFRVSSALDAGMIEQNIRRRKKLDIDDRGNRSMCSCSRGKRQNRKNDESASLTTSTKKRSKSKSEKSNSKRKKFNFKEEKETPNPECAKEQKGKLKERNRSDKSNADDSDESNSQKSFVRVP